MKKCLKKNAKVLQLQRFKQISKSKISQKSQYHVFCMLRWYNIDLLLPILTQVTVGENEGIESALRRFKRQVSKAGIFADLKRLRHHETPIEKYKRKLQQRRKARKR